VTDLEKRKKMLVAESEVYRQLLKLEIQNLRIYKVHARRKLTALNLNNPLLTLGLPMAASWYGRRRRSGWKRWSSWLLLGLQFYRQWMPLLKGGMSATRAEHEKTEAEEYLSKRI
jgi:hypothetical protein